MEERGKREKSGSEARACEKFLKSDAVAQRSEKASEKAEKALGKVCMYAGNLAQNGVESKEVRRDEQIDKIWDHYKPNEHFPNDFLTWLTNASYFNAQMLLQCRQRGALSQLANSTLVEHLSASQH